MAWWKRRTDSAAANGNREFRFVQCPGCSYNFLTDEGSRSCGWYDCPYLPEELKVLCPECNYNFATREGQPRCTDPPSCDWAKAGYAQARAARRFFGEGEHRV